MKQCKDAGIKIGKGEIKFGTWVTSTSNEFWSWSHWGCVTPKRVQNLLDTITEDGEKNFDLLDGYEDMGDADRARIRQALADGHVAEEDAIGMNKPSVEAAKQEQRELNKQITKLTKDVEKAERKDDDAAENKARKALHAAQKKLDELQQSLIEKLRVTEVSTLIRSD